MSAETVVLFDGVHKSLGGARVLDGVRLRVDKGETYTIVGGSGSGKSVLLKHVVGLLQPDSGRVLVFGEDVGGRSDEDLIPLRRRIGMVFQGAALFDSLTVHENVAYPLRQHRDWDDERIAARVEACLEAVGLPGIGGKLPEELSGGMRKRVGVARAIALEPELVLYDEPTTGLDPGNALRIGELVQSLQERMHVTSMIVTHDMELCFGVSDRIGLLRDGRIVLEGSTEELRGSDRPELRAFLEGASAASPPRHGAVARAPAGSSGGGS